MEITTFELNEMLKEGILQGILWTTETVQRAASCLARMPHLTELTILDNNRFLIVDEEDKTTFRTLLQVLVQHSQITRLSIAHGDLSSVLKDVAAVYTTTSATTTLAGQQLKELELVAGQKIRATDAAYLRQIVRIPSQTLSLSFHLKQKDYGAVLQALRQGLDDGKATTKSNTPPPRILFRNVSFPDHEFHLHRFLAMLCQAACVQGLQLSPRRVRVAHDAASMRVGPGFLPAVSRLLALDHSGVLESLEISNLVVEQQLVDDELVTVFRQALATNTSLQRLSMPCTKGMARIWQEAVFPALTTTNRTLHRLEFGHGPGVVTSFLRYLPHMRGLRSVQAPWRTPDGPAWMAAVPQAAALCHVHFCMVPNLLNDVIVVQPTIVSSCKSSSSSSSSRVGQSSDSRDEGEQEDYCLTQTRQWVERHRLTRLAHEILVQQPPETAAVGPWVERHLAGFVQTTDDVGLDARYVLLRESLATLVTSSSGTAHC